ncbi:hypothetical protein FHT40_003463 [Mycolicibacterium sp. BK556]|nr:hypothetical protein [Mycolicibacterium sp. BK556]MBB3633997.1 hypothetical protein [Mycolicibacterium sp. BK607]MBB3751578.1 hypothetical protein [Mycolicibacterium sp. BK634]
MIEDEPYRYLAAHGERIHFAERASQRCNTLMTQHAISRIIEARDIRPGTNVICDRSCLDFIPYSEYARAMGGEEGVPESDRRRTLEVRADMQEKNNARYPSDITAAFIDELWDVVVDSDALRSYDLIVFLPLTGDPAVDPAMEDDGIRSVESFYRNWIDRAFKRLYREELPRRAPLPCRFAELTGDREERVRALERIIDEMRKVK